MRYELTYKENNQVVVLDTVTGARYYGEVVNGYVRAKSSLSMQIISKALRQK